MNETTILGEKARPEKALCQQPSTLSIEFCRVVGPKLMTRPNKVDNVLG